jgi:hypothetical protein
MLRSRPGRITPGILRMGSSAGLDGMGSTKPPIPAENSDRPARSQFTVLTELTCLKDLAYFLKKGEETVSLSSVLIFESFDRFYILWYGLCTIRGHPSVVFCNVVRSVLSTWRTHELVRRERPYWHIIQGPKIMYDNRSSINMQHLLKWYTCGEQN